jgi:oxygen-dependent protoporphyrinogen oxidase
VTSKIAVLGGGMSGLASAVALLDKGREVTVYEASNTVGGRCQSVPFAGRQVVTGAYAFVAGDKNLRSFADRVGAVERYGTVDLTEGHVTRILAADGSTYDVNSFTIPSLLSCNKVPITQRLALARALWPVFRLRNIDPVRPGSAAVIDGPTALSYFRKMSPAFADGVLEPIIGMFFGYDEPDYSLAWLLWTFGRPRVRQPDLGWWTLGGEGAGGLATAAADTVANHPNGRVLTGRPVRGVSRDGKYYSVSTGDGEERFDQIVVALPAHAINTVLPWLDRQMQEFFAGVRYAAHDLAYFATTRVGALPGGPMPSEGVGLLTPRSLGFSLVSNVHVSTLPDGRSMVMAETKGRHHSALRDASDDEILDAIWVEVTKAIPSTANVALSERLLCRQDRGLVARQPGHMAAHALYDTLPAVPGLVFAGDYLLQCSVGYSVITGQRAARTLLSG